jgi:hypothetical protein
MSLSCGQNGRKSRLRDAHVNSFTILNITHCAIGTLRIHTVDKYRNVFSKVSLSSYMKPESVMVEATNSGRQEYHDDQDQKPRAVPTFVLS